MNKIEKISLLMAVGVAVLILWGEVQIRKPEVITYPARQIEIIEKESRYDKGRNASVRQCSDDVKGDEKSELADGDINGTDSQPEPVDDTDGGSFVEDERTGEKDGESVPELVESGADGEHSGELRENSYYVGEEYATESDIEPGLTYLGDWTITAYCSCEICCGSYSSGYTASGTLATAGRTIACNSLPIGTQVMIDGNIYTVEDTGWSPYGENWIDIYFDSHEEALAYGLQMKEVYLIE